MTRILLIFALCATIAVAGEWQPLPTTEQWTCPICGQCLPGNDNQFTLASDSLICKWYEEKFLCWVELTPFCVDHALPITWGTKIDSIVIVKADTLSVRWEPPNVRVIKADTIFHKGKVE